MEEASLFLQVLWLKITTTNDFRTKFRNNSWINQTTQHVQYEDVDVYMAGDDDHKKIFFTGWHILFSSTVNNRKSSKLGLKVMEASLLATNGV